MLGDISTGASNDLQTATSIARSMVMKYGMSDRLGAISYDSDQEVFIGRSMTQAPGLFRGGRWPDRRGDQKTPGRGPMPGCREILSHSREALDRTAEYLLEFETMSAEDFALVFDDPAALEQRKEEERKHRLRKTEEEKAHQARLQAEREAAQKAAQERGQGKAEAEAERPAPAAGPLLRASSHAAGSGTHPPRCSGGPCGVPRFLWTGAGPGGGRRHPSCPFGIDCTGGDPPERSIFHVL